MQALKSKLRDWDFFLPCSAVIVLFTHTQRPELANGRIGARGQLPGRVLDAGQMRSSRWRARECGIILRCASPATRVSCDLICSWAMSHFGIMLFRLCVRAREWMLGNNSPAGIASATSHLVCHARTHARMGVEMRALRAFAMHTLCIRRNRRLATWWQCSAVQCSCVRRSQFEQIYWTIDLCCRACGRACAYCTPLLRAATPADANAGAVSELILPMICFVMGTWPTKRWFECRTQQCTHRGAVQCNAPACVGVGGRPMLACEPF